MKWKHFRIFLLLQKEEEEEENLFEFVKDPVSVSKIPIEEELIDNGKIATGFGEAGEELVDVTLGLFSDKAAKAGEESSLPGGAFKPRAGRGDCRRRRPPHLPEDL